MKVVVKLDEIDKEIDTKDIIVNDITLTQLQNKVILLEKMFNNFENRWKKREETMIKVMEKIRGGANVK